MALLPAAGSHEVGLNQGVRALKLFRNRREQCEVFRSPELIQVFLILDRAVVMVFVFDGVVNFFLE